MALDNFGAKALGDLATNVIGFAVSVRLLQVFPFDFSGGFDWSLIVRDPAGDRRGRVVLRGRAAVVRLLRPAGQAAVGRLSLPTPAA